LRCASAQGAIREQAFARAMPTVWASMPNHPQAHPNANRPRACHHCSSPAHLLINRDIRPAKHQRWSSPPPGGAAAAPLAPGAILTGAAAAAESSTPKVVSLSETCSGAVGEWCRKWLHLYERRRAQAPNASHVQRGLSKLPFAICAHNIGKHSNRHRQRLLAEPNKETAPTPRATEAPQALVAVATIVEACTSQACVGALRPHMHANPTCARRISKPLASQWPEHTHACKFEGLCPCTCKHACTCMRMHSPAHSLPSPAWQSASPRSACRSADGVEFHSGARRSVRGRSGSRLSGRSPAGWWPLAAPQTSRSRLCTGTTSQPCLLSAFLWLGAALCNSIKLASKSAYMRACTPYWHELFSDTKCLGMAPGRALFDYLHN